MGTTPLHSVPPFRIGKGVRGIGHRPAPTNSGPPSHYGKGLGVRSLSSPAISAVVTNSCLPSRSGRGLGLGRCHHPQCPQWSNNLRYPSHHGNDSSPFCPPFPHRKGGEGDRTPPSSDDSVSPSRDPRATTERGLNTEKKGLGVRFLSGDRHINRARRCSRPPFLVSFRAQRRIPDSSPAKRPSHNSQLSISWPSRPKM
jgi:hypothetical protein